MNQLETVLKNLNHFYLQFGNSKVSEYIRTVYKKTDERDVLLVCRDWMYDMVQENPFNRGLWSTLAAIERKLR